MNILVTGIHGFVGSNLVLSLNCLLYTSFQGVKNKLSVALDLCNRLNITLDDVAYIGDDIPDIELLKKVHWSAAPLNAPINVQKIVRYVTNVRGGDGAFRDFVEMILRDK